MLAIKLKFDQSVAGKRWDMRQRVMNVLSVHEMTLCNTQHSSTSTSSGRMNESTRVGVAPLPRSALSLPNGRLWTAGLNLFAPWWLSVETERDSFIWITVKRRVNVNASLADWVLALRAFAGQYKHNTSKNPFPTFSLKGLSYHLHQTLQFLCDQSDCHLAVRRLDMLLVDVGSVSQRNVSDGDAQRPISGYSGCLVIILPSCPLSPIAQASAIRKCPSVSMYRTSH